MTEESKFRGVIGDYDTGSLAAIPQVAGTGSVVITHI